MGKEDTFFFEEDPAAGTETGVTGEEQADTFLSILEESGIIKDRGSLKSFNQVQIASEMDTKKISDRLVEVEFGTVKNDYVIHVTPVHPKKNLISQNLLNEAIKQTVMVLNKAVPPTLKVTIFLPRPDFEVKATSYIIQDGAEAWNFDRAAVEALMPSIMELVGKICMQS